MHPELLRHASDRSYPKAVLPPDLFNLICSNSSTLRLLSIALPVPAGRDRVGRSIAIYKVGPDESTEIKPQSVPAPEKMGQPAEGCEQLDRPGRRAIMMQSGVREVNAFLV